MNRNEDRAVRRGELVIATLREPREKLWGVLDEIADAGVYLRGIDVGSFDELARSVVAGEAVFGITDLFFPLWRVERIARDSRSGTIPSLAEQFAARTGFAAIDTFDHASGMTDSLDEIEATGDVVGQSEHRHRI